MSAQPLSLPSGLTDAQHARECEIRLLPGFHHFVLTIGPSHTCMGGLRHSAFRLLFRKDDPPRTVYGVYRRVGASDIAVKVFPDGCTLTLPDTRLPDPLKLSS